MTRQLSSSLPCKTVVITWEPSSNRGVQTIFTLCQFSLKLFCGLISRDLSWSQLCLIPLNLTSCQSEDMLVLLVTIVLEKETAEDTALKSGGGKQRQGQMALHEV